MMLLACFLLILIVVLPSDGFRSRSYDRSSSISYAKSNKKSSTESDVSKPSPEKNLFPKIGLGALVQLVTMGAGAPSLGEFKRWEGTKAIFELEANNLVDNEGNSLQTKKKYFLDGYVDLDSEDPPNFFENLLSGGKKMEEWTERMENQRKKK